MTYFDDLVARIETLHDQGVGGEDLEQALESFLTGERAPLDPMDALRALYLQRTAGRSLIRWALAELDSEVVDLEEVGLAA